MEDPARSGAPIEQQQRAGPPAERDAGDDQQRRRVRVPDPRQDDERHQREAREQEEDAVDRARKAPFIGRDDRARHESLESFPDRASTPTLQHRLVYRPKPAQGLALIFDCGIPRKGAGSYPTDETTRVRAVGPLTTLV